MSYNSGSILKDLLSEATETNENLIINLAPVKNETNKY